MPRLAPNQLLLFIASISVAVLLTPASSAPAQQKPAPPSPRSQTQLEDRVNQLETELRTAQQQAEKAAMEKDYILRTQNHYETYYKEVFSTQTHILWTIGLTATLLSITLTAVFFVAARFGFNIFDRRIEMALKEASAQLRTEFTVMLGKQTQAQREANNEQLKALEDGLTKRITDLEDGLSKRITQQEQDLKARSDFQFKFAQALTLASDKRHADATNLYRSALKIYKRGRDRQLIPKGLGVIATRNLFRQFRKGDAANSVENAKEELAKALYNDLEDELALAAVRLTWLTPLLEERTDAPIAEEPKTEKEKSVEPPFTVTPNDDE